MKVSMKERSLKELFHLIKKVLPEAQELVTFSPETTVAEALEVMCKRNFSQVPVVAGDQVLGVFSYRSLAQRIARLPQNELNILSLRVEEFLEDLNFAQITDELTGLLKEFDLKDAVLVGSEKRLQGIVTVVDALQYFYQVASAYVMLQEIELAIRELIRFSVDKDELQECINRSLKDHYDKLGRSVPIFLEEMSFEDYLNLLRFKGTWKNFAVAFGESSNIVCTKLKPIPELRNIVFHFRREITIEEYDLLRDVRDWLLKRIKKLEAYGKSDQDE